jgi:UDP-N-acetyl-2-amino-2-deoxyglucuronate dehydrogenase
MNKLQFALVGCGKIAPRHAAEMARHGQLAAVCDIVEERANKMAASYNARAYYSIEDLLSSEKNLDVLAVCSPNGLHSSHSIKSLEAGIHVLCEKPLAISTVDGNEMMNAATKSGRKLFVVKSTRYNPALANLKQLLESGDVGKIIQFPAKLFLEQTWCLLS